MIAEYFNNFGLDISLQKMGEGSCIFESRKILPKIMNAKLFIRVGRGLMLIDEFLVTYE